MKSREKILLDTLKNDLLSAIIILDSENNVIFINNTATNYIKKENMNPREFAELLLKAESSFITERKELILGERIIGFSMKIVYEGEVLNRRVIIFKDITEIKKKEKEEKKKEAMGVVGELAIYVAHEIKNTLNIINGFSQLMLESEDITNIKEHLGILIEETVRLNKLTHSMLDYTKIDSISTENVDLVDFTKELLQKYYSKDKISIFSTDNEVIASIDSDKMKQVFINIIQNGIEATEDMEEGIFNIYIEKDKNIDIIFETNKEVEEDFPMENMFSPYFTTKKNGNGLGLALCKKIVEEHRGVISVQKNFYRGLSFIVSLPIVQE